MLGAIHATLLSALPYVDPATVKGALHILEPGRGRLFQPGEETGEEDGE